MRDKEVDSNNKMKYALKFRALLDREKISPARFAEKMNLDKSRLSRLMSGALFPTVQDLESLKKVFPAIDLNEFLGDGLGITASEV